MYFKFCPPHSFLCHNRRMCRVKQCQYFNWQAHFFKKGGHCVRVEQWRGLGVCVCLAGACCLKIKGLRSKAVSTVMRLLHVLGYRAQILLRKREHQPARSTFNPKHFASVTWSSFSCLSQMLSVKDVERILDETRKSMEYKRVNVS